MKPALCVVVVSLICFLEAALPSFPPAIGEYQWNITYNPSFFYPDQDTSYKGVFRVKGPKTSVWSNDGLRTNEIAIWRKDKGVSYFLSEFGEFGYMCTVSREDPGTNFIPPFGFDQAFFAKNAKFMGQEEVSGILCDWYTVETQNKKGMFYFNAQTLDLVKITEVVGTVTRNALFADLRAVSQPDYYFEIPAKASC